MKIAVLGAGMVGRTIAADLSTKFEVTSFDINETNLSTLIKGTNTNSCGKPRRHIWLCCTVRRL